MRNSYNSLLSPMVAIPERARERRGAARRSAATRARRFVIAAGAARPARAHAEGHYNGKIDAPKVCARALSENELDALSAGGDPRAHGCSRTGTSPSASARAASRATTSPTSRQRPPGTCVNQPARGMTGWNWDCSEECYRHAPELYGAIHFHDDDLDDCRWETDIALDGPGRPAAATSTRCASSWARPRTTSRSSCCRRAARRPPTSCCSCRRASYLAYANDHIVHDVPVAQSILGHTSVHLRAGLLPLRQSRLGLSTYDVHSDGCGVCFSSSRRPIMNMRPEVPSRHRLGVAVPRRPAPRRLAATRRATTYDVATDLELHREGADLLRRYRVVLTGSHPEYYRERMLDAWQEYLGEGGRGMYLGSNGFYWVTSWHPEKPWLIEVRKCESGSRAWQAKPGEYYHATSGERGGLWRTRARAPQKLFGVGFTSEGFDRCVGYHQMPDAATRAPRSCSRASGPTR